MSGPAIGAEGPGAGREALRRLRRKALAGRIPIAGTFELTERCNLDCVHCYLGDRRGRGAGEMPGELLRALVAESIDAGCLDVLLTGGEALLRPDFPDIYREARERGALVTLFTNGTLVDRAHLALFRELPPTLVEVSLYGATAPVYERVTRVPGSFERCLAGVGRLLDAGVRLALKTVVLRSNLEEVEAMAALARSLGVRFRLDPIVCPTLQGDLDPLGERVDPAVAAGLQFADPRARAEVARHLAAAARSTPVASVYKCDAGVVAFYVDARGFLRPCLMATDMQFDTAADGFRGAWSRATGAIADPAWAVDDGCRSCADLPVCGYCPALMRLETGRPGAGSEYLCATGRARRAVIERGGPDAHQEASHVQ